MAWKIDDPFFDPDGLRCRYQEVSQEVGGKIIDQVQIYVSQLVKAMDQDRLQLFMECLGHIFRGAENCLHQGIEMEIPPFDDEGEDSEGWQ